MNETSPEIWLKNELTTFIECLQKTLDAIAWLPFNNKWIQEPIGTNYIELLKQMEKQLLCMWVRMQKGQWNSLENDLLSWNGQQKRKPDSILSRYHSLYESLLDWGSLHDNQVESLPTCWKSYLIIRVSQEEHLLKRIAKHKRNNFSEETISLAGRYLKLIKNICDSEPRNLCSTFYTILSPFTHESVYLPAFPLKESNGKKSLPYKTSKLVKVLLNSEDWEVQAETFLQMLKQLN